MTGDEATSSFAGEPQPVDVYHCGTWYAGELLGWRFDDSGRALARVRCLVDGLRHSTWKDLADLRLPEPETTAPAATRAPASERAQEEPARPPVVQWAAIGRHETGAPSSNPSSARAQPPPMDDDTRPHALLVDRDLSRRPTVPRPVVAPRPNTDRLGTT